MDPQLIMAAAKLGANFMGLLGSNKAQKANEAAQERQYLYQLDLQKQQQAWLEQMSNTAHQREVTDLKAAGLNPILSANGGATTPQSGMGSVGLTDDANAINTARQIELNGLQTGINGFSAIAQAKLNNAQAYNQIQQGKTQNSIRDLNIAQKLFEEAKTKLANKELSWFDKKANQDIMESTSRIQQAEANTAYNRALIGEIGSKIELNNAVSALNRQMTETEKEKTINEANKPLGQTTTELGLSAGKLGFIGFKWDRPQRREHYETETTKNGKKIKVLVRGR